MEENRESKIVQKGSYLESVSAWHFLLQHGLLHDAEWRGGGGGRVVAEHGRHQLRSVVLRVGGPYARHA